MVLDDRLQVIAGFVKNGADICDVGTDHGYLPIFLRKNNICNKIIATDINEKPLLNAKSNILKEGATDIDLRLCDGLAAVKKGEVDTVVIAGMGGEVISGILSRTGWLKDNNIILILQPMTSPEILREYLFNNGFEITAEKPVSDGKKIYSVMTAKYIGKKLKYTLAEKHVGKLMPDCEEGKAYILKQIKRFNDEVASLKNVESEKEHFLLSKQIVSELEKRLNGEN